ERAEAVLKACRDAGLKLVVAESCTGGLVTGALTEIPGSSDVVERGFVAYSDEAKASELGVDKTLIATHGAVSAQVVRAMAEGALKQSPAELSVAVTGIAGPGGATPAKAVGLVYIAAARRGGETVAERHQFSGDRTAIREAAVGAALALLMRLTEP
ncbi:MAG: CinA family protein, partial [Alphaproteobacteria bacterium]